MNEWMQCLWHLRAGELSIKQGRREFYMTGKMWALMNCLALGLVHHWKWKSFNKQISSWDTLELGTEDVWKEKLGFQEWEAVLNYFGIKSKLFQWPPRPCHIRPLPTFLRGFPSGSDGKESAFNVGDLSLIPELGRSPGEGNGYPLQYSCLENPLDKGAWLATAHRVIKSQTRLKQLSMHIGMHVCHLSDFLDLQSPH